MIYRQGPPTLHKAGFGRNKTFKAQGSSKKVILPYSIFQRRLPPLLPIFDLKWKPYMLRRSR